ncbi:hypothetical protein HQ496_06345, partial [bacterium]|nr:hypothetical protein [bacterium]
MKYPITALLIVVSLILMSAKSAPSSLPADFNDLTSAEQIEIVRSLQALIEDKYVLEKESHLLVAGLEYGIESGVFGESRSPEAFANVANQLLQKAFPDRHLGVLLPARYQEMVEMFGGSDEEVSDQPESHDGGGHKAAPEQHAAPQPHAAPQAHAAPEPHAAPQPHAAP